MSRRGIRSSRVLTPSGLRPATIVIEGETILAVNLAVNDDDSNQGDPSDEHLLLDDFGDAVIMPGLVDCHVHVNEPGRTEWEGFETATRAAAAGGVTAVVDMPLNCIPVTTSVDAFRRKLDVVQEGLHVDVGFWGGVVPGNENELTAMAEAGVLGSKAFLCHSGIDDFPNVSREDLQRAMPRLAEADVPMLAHAELDLGTPECPAGARSYQSWLDSRPPSWEDAAIEMLIQLSRQTGCAVHVVHLSSASAVPMLREARSEGLPISVETCPHYLCLTAEEVPDGDTTFKCAPPIRPAENRERLWDALAEGVIDFIISDHSPCTPGLKKVDQGDFGGAWGGIASLSLGLRSIWTEAQARGFGLEKIGEWMSSAPARFAGLNHRKGRIAAGMDADFCIWDPEVHGPVSVDQLHFRHPISPYVGRSVAGRVISTWLRGREIHRNDGTVYFDSPTGRPLLHRGRA